jgi:hypothetical protein
LEWLDEQAIAALIRPGFMPKNPAIVDKWSAWLEPNTAKGSPDISNPLRHCRSMGLLLETRKVDGVMEPADLLGPERTWEGLGGLYTADECKECR